MNLSDYLKRIDYRRMKGPRDFQVEALTQDSRQAGPGVIFVAVSGFTVDGHNFIQQALDQGCQVIIHEEDLEYQPGVCYIQVENTREELGYLAGAIYDYPSHKLKIVGITGTNGKTTTSLILKHLLEKQYNLAVIGTNGTYVKGERWPTQHTTPTADVLQDLFFRFVKLGVELVVMEVSSHALELGRVAGTAFDIGVFTNLSKDHLDLHGSMEAYYQAKKKLFHQVSQAVINTEDPYGSFLADQLRAEGEVRVIDTGFHDQDFSLHQLSRSRKASKGLLKTFNEQVKAGLPFLASYNLSNMLEALAVANLLGQELARSLARLESFPGVEGRFERVENDQDLELIIDYAHSPDALKHLLQEFDRARGRVYLVFGVAGDRTKEIRIEMGEVAAQYADYSYLTTDDPRVDSLENINTDVMQGLDRLGGKYEVIEDRWLAVEKALRDAQPNDYVIFAGKGHDSSIQYMDHVEAYDELEAIQAALKKRKKS